MNSLTKSLLALSIGAGLTAFASAADVTKAIAVISPTQGNKVSGKVVFTKQGDGVRVEAEISGLTPGKHGFHIHEFGDLTAPDGASLGGHFNPHGKQHGGPEGKERHAGDFGNIEADAQGNAKMSLLVKELEIEGSHGILGRGVVVHAKADDLKTQPSGDAGGRVGVGAIGVAKAQ